MTRKSQLRRSHGDHDAAVDRLGRGPGSWLRDAKAQYLDFVQGWAVNCLGHSPRGSSRRSRAQAGRLINCSPAFYNEPMVGSPTSSPRQSGLQRRVLLQQRRRGQRGRHQAGAQMGRAASRRRLRDHHDGARLPRPHARDDVRLGQAAVGQLFEPKVPGFPKVPLERPRGGRGGDHAEDTVAVMLEPIQGEAGVLMAGDDFLRACAR